MVGATMHRNLVSILAVAAACFLVELNLVRAHRQDMNVDMVERDLEQGDQPKLTRLAAMRQIERQGRMFREDEQQCASSKGKSADGKRFCMSALLRWAVTAMPKVAESQGSNWEAKGVEAPLCKQLGSNCKVKIAGASAFKGFLEADSLMDGLLDSVNEAALEGFSPGAGKSGSGFMHTQDKRFFFKVGIKQSPGYVDEVETLHNMIIGKFNKAKKMNDTVADTLEQHFKQHPDSSLNRVYGLYKISFATVSKWVLVMGDASHGLNRPATPYIQYDLKGGSRDPTRKAAPGSATLENGDFNDKQGENGKLHLSSAACQRLQATVKADVFFLDKFNVIDYSFLVGKAEHTAGVQQLPPAWQKQIVTGTNDQDYIITLIDYFNTLSGMKVVESYAKGGKFSGYGAGVSKFFESICPVSVLTRSNANRRS